MATAAHAMPGGDIAVQVSSRQIRKADETVGGWLLGLVDGTGNTPSQIIVTAVLGCVPVVGQLFDLRDLIRCVIALTVRGAGVWAWVDMVITIIGCIPGFGDAFKAGVKLARTGAKADRVFDAMRRYGRMDPEKALRQMDWGKVQREGIEMLNKMLDGIIGALDGWLVQLLAGRQQVRELIAALRRIKETAPRMIQEAIGELRKIVDDMLPSRSVASTAQVLPTQGRPRALPAPAGRSGPSAGTGRRRDTSGENRVGRGVPNSNQVRQSKRNRWGSGVPAQHIVDYHVKETRRPLRKINDRGRLVEEWDRLKKIEDNVVREAVINTAGIDHLWFGNHRGRRYTVGETKGSVWAQFSFLAGMKPEDSEAVAATRTQTADVLDRGEYDPNKPLSGGRSASATATITNEAALSDSSKRAGTLKATKTKGRQMSHRWVKASIETDSTIVGGAGVGSHKDRLLQAIRGAEETLDVPTVYHREVFMVTGPQYEQHDRSRGRKHVIQPPLIIIPDNVLVK